MYMYVHMYGVYMKYSLTEKLFITLPFAFKSSTLVGVCICISDAFVVISLSF